MPAGADVVVAGLGVLGAAAARALKRRGMTVIGLDRHRPPQALGWSHGGWRVYAEGALYVPLVDSAYRRWRELEQETAARLLRQNCGLSLGPEGGELVAGAVAFAREHGLDHEVLDGAGLRARFAAPRPPPGVAAVFDPAAGVLLAESCVEALLASAAAAGAELGRLGARLQVRAGARRAGGARPGARSGAARAGPVPAVTVPRSLAAPAPAAAPGPV